jgi:glycosyltransferase involved in cell wall biosynthesis
MKLKIGILGTRGIPNNYGGFEQFAQHISVALFMRGYEVFVYNSSHHPYKEKAWNGVQIIHCKDWEHKMGTFGQFFYDRNCINDARKRNFDVLFHFGYSSDSFWWHRWPKNTVNIVNMDGLEWKRSKYNWLTRRFLKWAESLAAKNADLLVADSPAIQSHILERFNKISSFIPYGASIFTNPDAGVLNKYQLKPNEYFMLIARMEPENNIEMILKGWLASKQSCPLLIIGDTSNRFGKYLSSYYRNSKIIFAGPLYDNELLNSLRYYSQIYFHGHSVGGTNPSLLEAMACGCSIAAHDNVFNKAVLQNEADYFFSANDVTTIINKPKELYQAEQFKSLNIEKIRTIYNPEKILTAYEELILNACHK